MPDLSRSYLYGNPLQALTREAVVSDVIFDQVFKSNKFTQYMLQKGMVDDKRGGAALTWINNFGKSPNTVAFDGDDNLPIASMNANLQRAALPWRAYSDALVLAVNDILDNEDSPEAISSLVEGQLDITKMSLVDKIATDILVNTPSINPKGLDGMAEAVDNGTVAPTYAGIGRTQFSNLWQIYVTTTCYSRRTSCRPSTPPTSSVRSTISGRMRTSRTPVVRDLIESLFSQDAYIQPEMARAAGGNDLIFNGNPLFIDNHVPTQVASPGAGTGLGGFFYSINSTYFYFVINPKAKFAVTDWLAAQNNFTVFVRIIFRGNLVASSRKPTVFCGSTWLVE